MQPRKLMKEKKNAASTAASASSSALPAGAGGIGGGAVAPGTAATAGTLPTTGAPAAPAVPAVPQIKLEEVVVPGEAEFLEEQRTRKTKAAGQEGEQGGDGEAAKTDDAPAAKFIPAPLTPPSWGTYSAVSRGVLRISNDGAHTCRGKWAMTREKYTDGQTSSFHFGLEAEHAQQAATAAAARAKESADGVTPLGAPTTAFPVDSPNYKGSFKMRRGTTKYTSVIDRQILLKFRQNTLGTYNVYGKGINSIGPFDLNGTLIPTSATSGQVELYRMYPFVPPPQPAPAPAAAEVKTAQQPLVGSP